jgi:hypothetical protein
MLCHLIKISFNSYLLNNITQWLLFGDFRRNLDLTKTKYRPVGIRQFFKNYKHQSEVYVSIVYDTKKYGRNTVDGKRAKYD